MSRVKKSILNFVSSNILSIIGMLITFWSLPIIIETLGPEKFGIYRSMYEWFFLPTVLSVALGQYYNKRIVSQIHDTDRKEIYLGLDFQIIIFFFLFLFIIALYFLAPHFFNLDQLINEDMERSFWLTVLCYALMPFAVYQSIIDSYQKTYILNLLIAIQRILIAVLSVYFVKQSGLINSQFKALFIGSLLFWLFVVPYAKKQILIHGKIAKWNTPDLFSSIKDNFNSMSSFFKIEVAGKMSIAADSIIIASVMDPKNVTSFFLIQRLPALIQNQLMGFGNSVWAGLAELIQKKELEKVRESILDILSMITVVSIYAFFLIFLFNESFLNIWLKQPIKMNSLLNFLFCINVPLISVISFLGWVMFCFHDEKRFSNYSIICALINLGLGIILTHFMGLAGPALASAISYGLIKLFWMLKYLNQKISGILIVLLNRIKRCTLLSIICGSTLVFIFQSLSPSNGWAMLSAHISAFTLIYILAIWFIAFDQKERKIWQQRVRFLRRS